MTRDPLLAAVVEITNALPTSLVETTARAVLAAGDSKRADQIAEAVPQPDYARLADKIARAWRSRAEVTAGELAAMLRGGAAARASAKQESRVEVVWTGPDTNEVPSRSTEAVVLEIVDASRHQLLLVTYAAFRYKPLVEALEAAHSRGVRTTVLVETREGANSLLSVEPAQAFSGIPGVVLFEWPLAERQHGRSRSRRLHAKLVVADRDIAFVTSANLTGNGIEENLECGLLVTGGSIPGQLADHVAALTRRGVFRPLTSEVPPRGAGR